MEKNVGPLIAEYCCSHGVMLLNAQPGSEDVLRGDALLVEPPLITTEEEMDRAIAVLKEAILHVYEQVKD